MKHIFRIFLLLICTQIITCDPLIVAVIMVKNEEPVMASTLKPLVDAGFTSFFIYDTGSTDNTIQVTRDFFQESGITDFCIAQEEWIDFAASRNRALRLTQDFFPHATFMLMLDAEWHLHNGEELLKFCEEQKDSSEVLYHIRIVGPNRDFGVPRLIRCNCNIQFVGRIHEIPNVFKNERTKVPNTIHFELASTHYGIEKSKKRWVRDCEILHEEFARNPFDCRTVFYLAQTYDCLGDYQNAIKWYKHRAQMPGWDEENFMTYYRLGQVYMAVAEHEQAIQAYFKAFCLRPHRAEPLVKLAEYYLETQQYALSFTFAKRAVELPYPAQDVLFIDKWFYDFLRYYYLGIAAWYVGEYEIGEQASLKVLEVKPDLVCFQRNLMLYRSKLHQINF